ncbi:MAG TPA: hypothetical protein VGS27_01995, partial [Candidatus Sulfotelmatobacter sp.]|nr:hypothetical protein [Candidatus Sulfotelmatobacter sp.]
LTALGSGGMKFAALILLLALFVCPACRAQADQQEVKHHGMMHAMDAQHLVSETAKLSVSNSAAANELTVRVGPVDLPAHTDHMAAAQPPVFFLTIPFDGWLTAFHPRLANSRSRPLPNQLLHHAVFYDTERPDFLCPKREEHIFGAGGEMNDWPAIPGFGYRVKKGDRIRISTMFANPTAKNYPDAFLEVRIDYHLAQPSSNAATLKDIYPAWFDVMGCGKSEYDLPPGQSTKTGEFKLRFSGRLLGVGGHLHDYGEWLVFKNSTTNETIATLAANLDRSGQILSMPVKLFTDLSADGGGFALHNGDVVSVTDAYNNPTGKSLPGAAMGIVVGYFLPDDPTAFTALGHQPHR